MPLAGPKIALTRFWHHRCPDVVEPLNAFFITHTEEVHCSASAATSWVGSDRLYAGPVRFRQGGGIVAFKRLENQLSVVFVGKDRQLNVIWRWTGTEDWQPVSPMVRNPHRPAPVGASLAWGALPPETSFVLFVDVDGHINSVRVDGGGHWQDAERVPAHGAPAGGIAEPGGGLVAINQTPGLLSVLFSERTTHLVHVVWRSTADSQWHGPALIHSHQTKVPPGAGMAAASFPDSIWYVFFVDVHGSLRAAPVVGASPWEKPQAVSSLNFAPPGASVAAVSQTSNLISAFVVGADGGLYRFWRRRGDLGWSGPQAITEHGAARPGASVTAAKQTDEITVVAFAGADGRPHICWTVEDGPWQGPARISWYRVVEPDVPSPPASAERRVDVAPSTPPILGATHVRGSTLHVGRLTGPGSPNDLSPYRGVGVDLGANTEHKPTSEAQSRLFIFFGDTTTPESEGHLPTYPPWDGDLVGIVDAASPAGGFPMSVVLESPSTGITIDELEIRPGVRLTRHPFHSFAVERLGVLGTGETPTGAFSYDGRAYVFTCVNGSLPISHLTSSSRPEAPEPFTLHFELSRQKLMQVAAWVVKNAEHPELPERAGDGLVMIASGRINMYLAWMPLYPGRSPDRTQLLYYAGRSARGGASWSSREQDAAAIFPAPPAGYTSVSLGWLEGPSCWLLLYTLGKAPFDPNAARSVHGSIVARIGTDLCTWSPEVTLFDPAPGRSKALKESLGWKEGESWAYGPFLLNRFHRWRPILSQMTIYYLLSTGTPYQVHLMRSGIRIAGVSLFKSAAAAIRQRIHRLLGPSSPANR